MIHRILKTGRLIVALAAMIATLTLGAGTSQALTVTDPEPAHTITYVAYDFSDAKLFPVETSIGAPGPIFLAQQASAQANQKVDAKPVATPFISGANCNVRTDFFQIYSSSGLTCYANAGETMTSISNVYKISSGNNSGYAQIWNPALGYYQRLDFAHWQTISTPSVKVVKVAIY